MSLGVVVFFPPPFHSFRHCFKVLLLPIKAMSLPHLLCFSIHSNKQGFCFGQLIILPKYSYLVDMAAKMPFPKYSYLMDRTAKIGFFTRKSHFCCRYIGSVPFPGVVFCMFLTCRSDPLIRPFVLRFITCRHVTILT